MFKRPCAFGFAAVFGAVLALGAARAAEEVNIYTSRQPFLIEPMLKAFTGKTGIKVNVVFDKKGLLERLKAEGANSPADVVLTVDIGRLVALNAAGVVQPVMTETLKRNIPANYHDEDGRWWALTSRARVIYASKERVKEGEIATYADLADPKWKGRVCTRPGDHRYNNAWIASRIAHDGYEATRAWLQGVKANLARKPQGNDRAQVKAIKEGVCDLAIGNTYYMAAMMNNEDQRVWAQSARIVFPDQNGDGVHMNVSGMVLTRSAPHKANAIRLMEFLSSGEAQSMYAKLNNEYPVRPGVEWSATVKAWGEFKPDRLPLEEIARLRKDAIRLVNEVDYNAGS